MSACSHDRVAAGRFAFTSALILPRVQRSPKRVTRPCPPLGLGRVLIGKTEKDADSLGDALRAVHEEMGLGA